MTKLADFKTRVAVDAPLNDYDFKSHRESWRAALIIARDQSFVRAYWDGKIRAYDEAFAAGSHAAIPDRLRAHHAAWRQALLIARDHARVRAPDVDEKAYWQHELRAYDRAFDSIGIQALPEAPFGSWSICSGRYPHFESPDHAELFAIVARLAGDREARVTSLSSLLMTTDNSPAVVNVRPETIQRLQKLTGSRVVSLPDGYNGATVRFYADAVAEDETSVRLLCAEPGKGYMAAWRSADEVSAAIKSQLNGPEQFGTAPGVNMVAGPSADSDVIGSTVEPKVAGKALETNRPDILRIAGAMDRVHWAERVRSTWWNDADINDVVNAGVTAGFLRRSSTTQVEWSDSGVSALKAAYAAIAKGDALTTGRNDDGNRKLPEAMISPVVARFRVDGNFNEATANLRRLIEQQAPALRTALMQAYSGVLTAAEAVRDQYQSDWRSAVEASRSAAIATPDFDAVRDKRMSEMTPAQRDDARELWLREQIGWMGEYHEKHYRFLLKRLDEARDVTAHPRDEKAEAPRRSQSPGI